MLTLFQVEGNCMFKEVCFGDDVVYLTVLNVRLMFIFNLFNSY